MLRPPHDTWDTRALCISGWRRLKSVMANRRIGGRVFRERAREREGDRRDAIFRNILTEALPCVGGWLHCPIFLESSH